MKVLALLLFLVCQLTFAQDQDFFAPTREGASYFELSNKYTKKVLAKISEKELAQGIDSILNRTFNEELGSIDILFYTGQVFEKVLSGCRAKSKCERQTLEAIFLIARSLEKIDDVFLYLILNTIDEKNTKAPSMLTYFYKLEFTQKLREKIGGDNKKVVENLFNSGKEYIKKEKGFGKLTPRQRLFLFYSESEMETLNSILRTFLNRNFSTESYLIFELENGEKDRVDLSETEKYKAAVALLNRDIKRAYEEGTLKRYPLYSDLLALGLETGVISNEMLNEMLKLPEMQDPYTPFWKKVGLVAYRVGRTVLMINPTTSLYAMTAFLVIDSVRQIKEENEKVSDDHLF